MSRKKDATNNYHLRGNPPESKLTFQGGSAHEVQYISDSRKTTATKKRESVKKNRSNRRKVSGGEIGGGGGGDLPPTGERRGGPKYREKAPLEGKGKKMNLIYKGGLQTFREECIWYGK